MQKQPGLARNVDVCRRNRRLRGRRAVWAIMVGLEGGLLESHTRGLGAGCAS